MVSFITEDGLLWFPRHISDLDESSNRVLMQGADLDAEHPVSEKALFVTSLLYWYSLICDFFGESQNISHPCL